LDERTVIALGKSPCDLGYLLPPPDVELLLEYRNAYLDDDTEFVDGEEEEPDRAETVRRQVLLLIKKMMFIGADTARQTHWMQTQAASNPSFDRSAYMAVGNRHFDEYILPTYVETSEELKRLLSRGVIHPIEASYARDALQETEVATGGYLLALRLLSLSGYNKRVDLIPKDMFTEAYCRNKLLYVMDASVEGMEEQKERGGEIMELLKQPLDDIVETWKVMRRALESVLTLEKRVRGHRNEKILIRCHETYCAMEYALDQIEMLIVENGNVVEMSAYATALVEAHGLMCVLQNDFSWKYLLETWMTKAKDIADDMLKNKTFEDEASEISLYVEHHDIDIHLDGRVQHMRYSLA
jgi:hypothetical protein